MSSAGPAADLELFGVIEASHGVLVGGRLADGPTSAARARWVYERAPYGLLAHGTGEDPVFTYANRTAQDCFERTWQDIVGSPSRSSAGEQDQADRERLLADVATHGVARGYRGLRVAASGRRFWIEDVVMWTLLDRSGVRHGQAALFPRWSPVG